ncbi:DUF4114 domain-containing protein [Aquabacter sp. CN5-332]|uniref:DUF4114 domain-containing protein n=1 Tax=Aquabacter sp. CN5-332 TaxID=3156608 RepID=UPI0032B510C9
MTVLANSSYLDQVGWQQTAQTTVKGAFGIDPANVVLANGSGHFVTVALTLPRAHDPADFLEANWAERQAILAAHGNNVGAWYGTDPGVYQTAVDTLSGMGIGVLGDAAGTNGYISSAESRTIWVSLDVAQFQALFSSPVYLSMQPDKPLLFYEGNLSLPAGIPTTGLMLYSLAASPVEPLFTETAPIPSGGQSIGNNGTPEPNFPQDIAALYNFPLTGNAAVDGVLGLIQPGVGTALSSGATQTFAQLLDAYLASAGVTGHPSLYTVDKGGQSSAAGEAERSLDIGVTAAVNPFATYGFYAGSGQNGLVYAAYQAAIWDLVHNPSVLSSSFVQNMLPAPDSPFYRAVQELFLDAALRNQSLFIAAGDGGSSAQVANGLPNLTLSNMNPYSVLVGGTSLTTAGAAVSDDTLTHLLAAVHAKDLGTIWSLVEGGLTTSPSSLTADRLLVETVWNDYALDKNGYLYPGYTENYAGAGGVDTREGVPSYQADYGLTPTAAGPNAGIGRGVPDVSALSGGNMQYTVPGNDMSGTAQFIGTSAAAPLWASLALQINTIFADQGLPQLGYMNDLLYIASAIAPASFNDVTSGNSTSSFILGGSTPTRIANTLTFENISATGIGYEAGPGYDLATGLGSPNGLLLARALTAIAHSQMYFSDTSAMLEETGSGWLSGASQTLLFQPVSGNAASWGVSLGTQFISLSGVGTDAYGWTSRFAQQSLQADFSPDLVTMFDGQGLGQVTQAQTSAGAHLSITQNGAATVLPRATMTSDFGFADFAGADGSVHVARPVAVAETAGGADDQDVVVRLRQNGINDLSVMFYKVDDFNGTIGGLAPGQGGYDAATNASAYHLKTGGTWMDGGGYGIYGQSELVNVDAGDLIAMKISNGTDTFYAFTQANEQVGGQSVGHIWNYGLNTWGWEDLYGGGDQDFNDLVVQLDFTSASGSGYLI